MRPDLPNVKYGSAVRVLGVPPSGGPNRVNAGLQTLHRESAFHLASVTRLHEGRTDEEQDDIHPIERKAEGGRKNKEKGIMIRDLWSS